MPENLRELGGWIAEVLGWKRIKNVSGNVFFVSPAYLATAYFRELYT